MKNTKNRKRNRNNEINFATWLDENTWFEFWCATEAAGDILWLPVSKALAILEKDGRDFFFNC